MRGGSPAGRGGGRGASLDRGTNVGSPGRGQQRGSPLSKVVEDDQDPNHRASVNFSRPISPPQSPVPGLKPAASAKSGGGWFTGPVVNQEQTFRDTKPRPKTSEGFSAYELQNAQQAVHNAANRPVSTRRTQLSSGVEGARLATGSMRARPSGTAVHSQSTRTASQTTQSGPRVVDPNSPFAIYDPSSRQFIHKQDAMKLHRAMSEVEDPVPPYEDQHDMPRVQHAAPQYSQPVKQPVQNRQIVQRSGSASPAREPQTSAPRQQAASVASSLRTKDIQPSHASHSTPTEPPVTWTSRDFVEAERRLSIDANTSQKPESSAPEKNDANAEPEQVVSPKLASNQESAYPHLEPAFAPSTSDPSSAYSQGSGRSHRTQSLSPPRNAHFASVGLELPDGVKHQPPPRSVSPAKSALKSSPSVSRRSHSPLHNESQIVNRYAVSEHSDAVSEDGKKKKKKVRISFDEEPTVAGISAYADEDPADDFEEKESDLDDVMKPRPVLPSFGSIRDKNRRSRDDEAPEKVTETIPSSLSSSATLTAEPMGLSSDHKIGGLLADSLATSKTTHVSLDHPVPPEVTSVEGTGYVSDSDQSEASYAEPLHPISEEVVRSTPKPEPKTLTLPAETSPPALEVPVISIQPASPPLSEKPPTLSAESKAPRPFVPGGWDEDDLSEPEYTVKQTTAITPEASTAATSSSPASAPTSTTITFDLLPSRVQDDDSSDDNSSIYSDAYEDLEEDQGFASIDAVVGSPAASDRVGLSASRWADTEVHYTGLESSRWSPVNTSSTEPEPQIQQESRATGRNSAQEHRSGLSDSRKEQAQSGLLLDRLATEEKPKVISHSPAPVTQSKQEPRSKAYVTPATSDSKTVPLPATKPASQPRKSALKKPSNDPPPVARNAEIPLKKTMREHATPSTTEPHLRKTMRESDATSAGRKSTGPTAGRQNISSGDTKSQGGALQKKHLQTAAANSAAKPRPQSAGGAPVKAKPVIPTPTYDSDSDASASSFQRQRSRPSRRDGGRYTMRASMRSGTAPSPRAAPPMRSISPPVPTSPPSTLRKSMRPSSPRVESPSGVKSSRFSIRSLSPTGRFRRRSTAEPAQSLPVQSSPAKKPSDRASMFGKSSTSKSSPAQPSSSRFKSRFDDSSDEEMDRPRHFQSRFSDSDDDDFELPPGLAPVRGIPKKVGEEDGDSTDLEEELSDAEPSPAIVTNGAEKGKGTTNGATNGQGASFAAGSMRQSMHAPDLSISDTGKKSKAKRGFFGLGRKKTAGSYIPEGEADTRNGMASNIPMPPEQRNRDRNRPLTPIGEDGGAGVDKPTTHPPNSRRVTPALERSTSDSWPLPTPPMVGEDQRPQSSDGPISRRTSIRPALVKRHSSQISQARTEIDEKTGKTVSFGRTGKKKKFQGLRRVFGLND